MLDVSSSSTCRVDKPQGGSLIASADALMQHAAYAWMAYLQTACTAVPHIWWAGLFAWVNLSGPWGSHHLYAAVLMPCIPCTL